MHVYVRVNASTCQGLRESVCVLNTHAYIHTKKSSEEAKMVLTATGTRLPPSAQIAVLTVPKAPFPICMYVCECMCVFVCVYIYVCVHVCMYV
jgi:hypothetical protein